MNATPTMQRESQAPAELPSGVVLAFGADGAALFPKVLDALNRAPGGSRALAACGQCQWERPTDGPLAIMAGAPSWSRLPVPDITLTATDLRAIRADVGTSLGAGGGVGGVVLEGVSDASERALRIFGDKLLTVVPPSAPIVPQLLGLAGLGDIARIAPTLRHWKTKRLPHLTLTLVVRWPEPGHFDAQMGAAVKTLQALCQDRIVEVIYAIDPRSPRARALGEDTQTWLLARAFAAQLVAHRHDAQNKRLAEVSRSLGAGSAGDAADRGGFATLCIGAAPVAVGAQPALTRLFRRRLHGDVGYGDVADCIRQATDLAARLREDERARTFAVPFDGAVPPYELLFVVPFAVDDPRFATIVRAVRHWQIVEAPAAGTPIVTSGNGWMPSSMVSSGASRYFCLAAYLFPVADATLIGDRLAEDGVARPQPSASHAPPLPSSPPSSPPPSSPTPSPLIPRSARRSIKTTDVAGVRDGGS